jgi:hypothetical protein
MGIDDLVPGKDLEKAAADIVTDAGKGLIRGIARTLGAATAEWTAKKEARADAARKVIETQADIDRQNALQRARRTQEIEEVEHETTVELAKRRASRMILEMAHEQENLESITRESLRLIEHDPDAANARELDEDWLFRFAEFAERVSDREVQKIWAHVLKAASIEGGTKLSAAALLQLSLVDSDAAASFDKFCRTCRSLGIYPAHERSYSENSLQINLMKLVELGLIKEASATQYKLLDFRLEMGTALPTPHQIPLFHTVFHFTQRGSEIANAVFSSRSPSEFKLSEAEEDGLLSELVRVMVSTYKQVLIQPTDGQNYFIVHANLGAAEPIDNEAWTRVIDSSGLSSRLRRLLDWARSQYSVSVHHLPTIR